MFESTNFLNDLVKVLLTSRGGGCEALEGKVVDAHETFISRIHHLKLNFVCK